ncbi:MAG: DUF58 domain-containing protein, partial [Lentisphaerae bacterium]
TKRGFFFIFFFLLISAICFFRPNLFIAIINALVWSALIVAFFWSLLATLGVRVSRLPTQDGFRGVMLKLPIRVQNLLPLPRQSFVVCEKIPFTPESWQVHVIPPLAAHEQLDYPRTILPVRRGEFVLDKLLLRGSDPLGLFCVTRVFREEQKMLIQPAAEPISWLPLARKEKIISNEWQLHRKTPVGLDFFGVREYRPYDNVRHIDWKATARHQQTLVREYEENSSYCIAILLDLERKHVTSEHTLESNFEYLVKVAASLANYLATIHCEVLFCAGNTPGESIISGPSQGCRQDIMHLLTHIEPGDIPITQQLDMIFDEIPANSIFYCLTLQDAPFFSATFLRFLEMGIDLRWIYAPPILFADFATALGERAFNLLPRQQTTIVEPCIVHPRFNVMDALMLPQLSGY